MFLSWLPENVSSFGRDIDGIIALVYYITLAWFVVTMGTLVVFVVRYRRRPGRPAGYIKGDRWREAAWVLVPLALVLVLDFWIDFKGARVWAKVKIEAPQSDVVIRVTGKQFNWVITYPGPDGRFDTADDRTLLDELHIPAGRPVRLTLEACFTGQLLWQPPTLASRNGLSVRLLGERKTLERMEYILKTGKPLRN